ncbi:bifunctional proline dehydrogenase/L-glutamate gamma-semialdehyde dehydrogenase [Blastococcus sp. Marseille-P5729]|uniref:bifunctional proline dehydrogenase/L-glutamate gamma-semialdehyde dehydrogenase n=1 Tax=Blastococcus sp. Marseille-P5729 TaxID=2086582 RepID=UPI000D0FBFD9|nr:bifunctional proline dehydrogenase/L-glutamate gamma-semialdehyde dehydrogenase [Blastococcus sp. Marseille-P5729]
MPSDSSAPAPIGHPDPADLRRLAPAAVLQVRVWLAAALQHPAGFAARQLAGVLEDPHGLEFTVGFVDRVVRPEDTRIAAEALRDLAARVPTFLPWYMKLAMRVGGRLAPLVPRVAVPVARRVLRSLVSHLIVDASESRLGPAIAKIRRPGVRLNINLLGEAILGREEAERRLTGIRTLIERPDVDYVSVKVSAATAPHSPWAFEQAVDEVTEHLLPLYQLAARQACSAAGATFINLDMEEYHDLDMTLAVFMRIMDHPELRTLPAGIVLQAYLPDAMEAMTRLQAWAAERVDAGGAPIKVRVVKGANLPMEQMQASLMGWPQAPYQTKQATDANYKRVLNYALTPEHTRNVRVGVAGHNLFDIALAWLLAQDRGLSTTWPGAAATSTTESTMTPAPTSSTATSTRAPDVEFEMLLGMATGQAEAVKKDVGSLLLYTPVVHPAEFDVAISYLVRRLEEGASQENFMSAVFELDSDQRLFDREEQRFLASVQDVDLTVPAPQRSQNRLTGETGPVPLAVDGFANTPDTDPSLEANRDWGRQITSRIPSSSLGRDTVESARVRNADQIDAVLRAAGRAGETWRTRSGAEREAVLRLIGDQLELRRGDLLEVVAAETGKTLDQGDPEISEAIDFARYYGRLARGLDEVAGARFEPSRLTVVIPPWNFPVAIPVGGVLAALAAGSPVVFKPAPQSVRTGAVAYDAIRAGLREAGIADAEQLVSFISIDPDDEDEVGRSLITHPDVERVILTGGYETAKLFRSFRSDLPLLAETSGKNAIIVTPSADLDLAAKDVVSSAFGHAGQKCSASSLVILVGSVATSKRFRHQLLDAASSLHVGYPADPRAQMGPVIEPPGEKLTRGLTQLADGERWLLQPRRLDDTERLWSPGIRTGVRPGSDAHLTEYFGPVLGVMSAQSLKEAVGLVNAVDYGLTSGLHSLDADEIGYWLEHVRAGNLYVNRGITGAIVRRQPFGGWKRSAVGAGTKAGGPHYLHGLGTWHDRPVEGIDGARPTAGAGRGLDHEVVAGLVAAADRVDDAVITPAEVAWLLSAIALDDTAWRTSFGAAHDISALVAERNVLRHLPLPVLVRHESGPVVHLLRVLAAGVRAGAPLTVSVPRDLPSEVMTAVRIAERATVVVESTEQFQKRALQWTRVPASADDGGDPRVRLVLDWDGDADAARAAVTALFEAVDGSPDLAVYAGPVVSAGEVELLPFVREQAVAITAHRFGTPDGLTDDLL